ncbi:FadR/GntR family transcriptional regulator [Microbacterium allomyrinae]|uniref:FadR family transcriptional regulator n=1 Tax=Microbacterium allomyrinae TaxID=2830666 RepID=A0A9X1S367_9MICO|nr:FCD domain-containing protein [Microbacterium allomyrinae]MCC2031663.1 FadR family transcriptional regulator [Microbacterium allomyrinae]
MPDPLEVLVGRLLALATVDADTGRRRLPPERELGEALGMSRGMLREQLAVLERLGFLHRTQGRGTFIENPSYDFVRTFFAIARELGYLTDAEFSESRVLLEEALAEAAAHRATPEQIAALRDDVDRMVASDAAGDAEDAHDADVAFHRRLQRVVDNSVLRFLHEGLSHVLRDDIAQRRLEVAKGGEDGNAPDRTDSVHYEIVDAIEARDPAGARLAMRRHFGGAAPGLTPGLAVG